MKKYIAAFAFILFAAAALAQNGLTNVFVQRNINGDQVTMQVMLTGPGANDVTAIDMIFSNGTDCRVCTTTLIQLTPSSGNTWIGSGIDINSAGLTESGTIRVKDGWTDYHDWTYYLPASNGNGNSANQAWKKASNEYQ